MGIASGSENTTRATEQDNRTEVKPDGARKTRGETREGGGAEQKDQENLHFLLVRL